MHSVLLAVSTKESHDGTIFSDYFDAPAVAGRTAHFSRNAGSHAGAGAPRRRTGTSRVVRSGTGSAHGGSVTGSARFGRERGFGRGGCARYSGAVRALGVGE